MNIYSTIQNPVSTCIHTLYHSRMCLLSLLLFLTFQATSYSQPPKAEINAAIKRGISYLKQREDYGRSGMNAFVAYTLIKAGESPDSPYIQNCIKNILADHMEENKEGELIYKPKVDFNYCAGAQLMVLEAISPEKYYTEIVTTTDFLIKNQRSDGSWFYDQDIPNNGDTSVSQYAILGLWAAERAGVLVPTSVWDKAARWHLTTQLSNGAFTYQPKLEPAQRHTMAVAGTGSLAIISMQLYPNGKLRTSSSTPVKKTIGKQQKKRFGFLEKVDLIEKEDKTDEDQKNINTKPTVSYNGLEAGKTKGLSWIIQNFNVRTPSGWPIYYLYGIERLGAITDSKMLGPHDWYAEGARHLVETQAENGCWDTIGAKGPNTCLAVIFLTKATVKTLDRKYTPEPVGSGLLAGGRGLPKDLAEVRMRNGKVENKSVAGDLGELLAQLEDPANADLEATQETLVETITLGDREQLIQQKERVLKLIEAKAPDVRRIAIWALARTNDFRVTPYLIRALKDPDLGVRIEARNGLCTLSRKIRGLGLPEDPLADVDEKVDEKKRILIVDQWSNEATKRWQKWYNGVKPFDEKFDLYEVLNQFPKSKVK